MKEVTTKANFLLGRIEDFKALFKDIFSQGFPNLWDEQGVYIKKNEYHVKLQEKRNGTYSIEKLGWSIKGQHVFEILDKDLFLFHEIRKVIFGLPPSSYNFYFELEVISREMLATYFLANSIWKRISMFANKWNIIESPSTTTSNSQDNRM